MSVFPNSADFARLLFYAFKYRNDPDEGEKCDPRGPALSLLTNRFLHQITLSRFSPLFPPKAAMSKYGSTTPARVSHGRKREREILLCIFRTRCITFFSARGGGKDPGDSDIFCPPFLPAARLSLFQLSKGQQSCRWRQVFQPLRRPSTPFFFSDDSRQVPSVIHQLA